MSMHEFAFELPCQSCDSMFRTRNRDRELCGDCIDRRFRVLTDGDYEDAVESFDSVVAQRWAFLYGLFVGGAVGALLCAAMWTQ